MTAPAPTSYDERLWLGFGGWFLVAVVALSIGAAFAPINALLGLGLGVAALAAGVAIVVVSTGRVRIGAGELTAGPAHVALDLLAAPRALDRAQLRTELGPDLDARAFCCLRGWIPTAVRVELRDPADPTPYWVVSTREPHRLVAALLQAGARPSA